ncbi:MAG: hypothetical protein WCO15_09185, partial [Actinomycetota bacterium]
RGGGHSEYTSRRKRLKAVPGKSIPQTGGNGEANTGDTLRCAPRAAGAVSGWRLTIPGPDTGPPSAHRQSSNCS